MLARIRTTMDYGERLCLYDIGRAQLAPTGVPRTGQCELVDLLAGLILKGGETVCKATEKLMEWTVDIAKARLSNTSMNNDMVVKLVEEVHTKLLELYEKTENHLNSN